jgi:hypothetical protein
LETLIVKQEYIEGKAATGKFERAMRALFKTPKPPKHKPKKRKKGKD